MKMQVYGEKIKLLREQRCWTQQQLSEMSGISTRTLQRLEAKSYASKETIKSLAAVFEIDCDLLLPLDTLPAIAEESGFYQLDETKQQQEGLTEEEALNKIKRNIHARNKFYMSLLCLIAAISFGFFGVFSAHDANKISFETFQLLKNSLSIVLIVSVVGAIFRAYRNGIISKSNIL